jgi:hypothetical protein
MCFDCGKKKGGALQAIRVRVIVFNATFNNISVISWQSVLLVEETRVPGENHRLQAIKSFTQITRC